MADLDAKALALTYEYLLTKDKNMAEVFKSKFNAVSRLSVVGCFGVYESFLDET